MTSVGRHQLLDVILLTAVEHPSDDRLHLLGNREVLGALRANACASEYLTMKVKTI